MKVSELFESAVEGNFKVAKGVIQNIEELVKFARSLDGIEHDDVDWKGLSLRVWTRGDGTRYKEPGFVKLKNSAQAKNVFDRIPGKILQVSGEFGSSQYSPAKKSGGFLFVLDDRIIRVTADSVLRNSTIWRVKKDTSLQEAKELPAHLIPRWPGKANKVSGLEDFKGHMIQIGGTKKIANDEKKLYHAKGGKICGIWDPITSTGHVYIPTVKEDLNEGFEAELADAVKMNWLSWPNSKIVKMLKFQMESGKWPELKGKSDDELHDYVDNAKDDARNQVDESLNEGMYVIKNKDGKEKRFKDHSSPEAKAWKETSTPKKSTVKLAVYSDAYWAKKEDDAHDKDDYDFVTPWKPIKNDYAATDKINAVVEDQFNTNKIDWTLGKGSEIKREGTTCAAIVVRVSFEYGPEDDMGFDDVRGDTQNILVARNPKKPSQIDFVQFA